jgi:hypothetical protein
MLIPGLRIVVPSGLTIESTTTWGASSSSASTHASGAFNVAAGSIIVVVANAGYDDFAIRSTPTITDNFTLVWALQGEVSSGNGYGNAAVWTSTAYVPLTGLVVTIGNIGANPHGIAATAWAISGHRITPFGGTGSKDGGATMTVVDATVPVQATGSYLFGAFQRGASLTPPTYRGDTTKDSADYAAVSGGSVATGHLTNATTTAGNIVVGCTTDDNFTLTIATEIKPPYPAYVPTAGVGTAATDGGFLWQDTAMPTWSPSTMTGFFYYAGQTGSAGTIAALRYDIAGSYNFLGLVANSDQTFGWTSDTGAINGPTLVPGNWYFWALVNDGLTFNAYIIPADTAITGVSIGPFTIPAGNPSCRPHLLAWPEGGGPGQGYVARARGWSAALSVAELNAERISATAVKAGAVFDEPLASTSSLGVFGIYNGTLNDGPIKSFTFPASTPSSSTDPSVSSLTLGTRFRPTVDGYILGIRFYQAASSNGNHLIGLYNMVGSILAFRDASCAAGEGWREILFPTAVAISNAAQYRTATVTMQNQSGNLYYMYESTYHTVTMTESYLEIPIGAGVYAYNGTYDAVFPTQVSNNSAYFVTPIFKTR